jgi:ribonuclease Z
MQVAILGSGSATPDPARGNPSQAVTVDGEVLLFDCGERTTVNLIHAGINPLDVTRLFFTHLDYDHICDFGYLMMSSWNCGRRRPLEIYGPPGTAAMVHASIYGVHATQITFMRRYIEQLPAHIADRPIAEPAHSVTEIEPGFRCDGAGWRLSTGEVIHHQRCGVASVSYRVDSRHGAVAITGDTSACPGVVELARGADVLVHDTAFLDEIIAARGMWSHSGPTIAGQAAQAAGVRKLVLTHLGPYTSPQPAVDMAAMYYGGRRPERIWDDIAATARRHFDGPVVLAHDGLVIDVG